MVIQCITFQSNLAPCLFLGLGQSMHSLMLFWQKAYQTVLLLDWEKLGPAAPDPKPLDLVPDPETMGLGIPYQILGVCYRTLRHFLFEKVKGDILKF